MTRPGRPQHEPTTPLGKALRALRNDAKLGGVDVAKRAGISQTVLSRYELGERVPEPAIVKTLCRIYGAPADTRRELVALADATFGGNVSFDVVRKRGAWQMQERVARAERAASTIIGWRPAVLDGLCQTRAYARAMFPDNFGLTVEDIERTVDARMARQDVLRSGREFRIAHAEGALMWCMGSPAVMVEQLDHLLTLSHLPNVELGTVPYNVAARVPPLHNFTIYDRSAVHFGTGHETHFVAEYADVKRYLEYWTEYEPLIVWGEKARAVFRRVRGLFATL
ncbi:MAG: helix-turn-helix domain-containing protein [Haloechinothrix sp.]